ncbi:ABC transporter permease [Candidatus Pacearchaeota archaeon]|nr:ABC transporter permease [Candidatus Pacearchaeota archaeon]
MVNYFFLAFRNIRKKGIRSWLTILGIFIGVTAVVSLISLGNGLETAITSQFAALSTDRLLITNAEAGFGPPGSTAIKKLSEHDLELIESIQGIKRITPRLIRVAKVEFNDVANFDFVGSAPEEQDGLEALYEAFNLKIEEGRLLRIEDRGKIVLGDDFANPNRFGKQIRLGDKIKIQSKEFEVIGFLKRSGTFIINSAIIMPEEDMKDIFNINDEIDLIVVQVKNPGEIESIAKNMERKLRKDRNLKEGEEDFSVQTPVQSLESVNTILNIINLVVSGIAAISLFIGGIGIANTMFTSVLERTREIGIMKAIGAKNRDVLAIFLIESGLLGLVGGIVGVAFGLSLAFLVSTLANSALNNNLFQVSISLPLLIGSVSFSFLIGIVSGLIPAYQASKLNPVDALRK